jgi:hypothetical protein
MEPTVPVVFRWRYNRRSNHGCRNTSAIGGTDCPTLRYSIITHTIIAAFRIDLILLLISDNCSRRADGFTALTLNALTGDDVGHSNLLELGFKF